MSTDPSPHLTSYALVNRQGGDELLAVARAALAEDLHRRASQAGLRPATVVEYFLADHWRDLPLAHRLTAISTLGLRRLAPRWLVVRATLTCTTAQGQERPVLVTRRSG